MKYRTRTYYTDVQKALMWERWKQGWTLHQIAHLFDRAHGSVRGIFDRTGGFRPPQRSRSPLALTLAEREEISRSVAEGQSIRSIAVCVRRTHLDHERRAVKDRVHVGIGGHDEKRQTRFGTGIEAALQRGAAGAGAGGVRRPGASVAKVAMSHGINANVVHRWRQAGTRGTGRCCDARR